MDVVTFSQGMERGLIHPEKQGPGPINERQCISSCVRLRRWKRQSCQTGMEEATTSRRLESWHW